MNTVYVLVGPTASGKSAVALELAGRLNAEIVGMDSLQVFRELDIGTAKPDLEDRKRINHHLIDVLDPDQEASAAWYATQSRAQVDRLMKNHQNALLVGGCGFYFRAFEHPPIGDSLPRVEVTSLDEAYQEIVERDPAMREMLHPNDTYRIQRALTILRSGKLPSAALKTAKAETCPYRIVSAGLALERKALYDRIDRRMEAMFHGGLIDETRAVLGQYPRSRRRLEKAIGYREALLHVEGKMQLNEAVAKAQMETRRYAKRQLTWFRRDTRIRWFDASGEANVIARQIADWIHT